MFDYLKDYKIVPKSHTFDTNDVKFKQGDYQIIKFENFFFCLSEGSDIVFRFKNESPYRTGHIHVSIMKKNRVICEHFFFVASDLKHRIGTQIWQWFEHFVYLVQTSFYVLLEKRERNEVVAYLNKHHNSVIRVQVLNRANDFTNANYVFVSMDISIYTSNHSLKKDIFVSLHSKSGFRLMSNHLVPSSFIFDRTLKRYAIREVSYYKSLNEDFHYYELSLVGNNYEKVMVLYDIKKKNAKFILLTYPHGEPVSKKRNIAIESENDFHTNIFNLLEKLYLHKHPSEALISHFNNWHMDISNGINEDHRTVLDMFEI